MPELPDLAVFSENLQARLQGKTVHSVQYEGAKRLNTSPERLRDLLRGSAITSVRRDGKEIAFAFSNQATLLVHLMVKGEFSITTDPSLVTSAILTLGLESESLVVRDPKGLIALKLNPTPNTVPDALEVDGTYLRNKISDRPRIKVKEFLLDQSILRGIGNAYADEILWEAGIAPKSVVGRIPDRVIDELVVAIKNVLTDAIGNQKAQPQYVF